MALAHLSRRSLQHGAASRELAVVGATAMWRQSHCMLKLVLTLRTTGFAGAASRRLACLGSAPRHTAAATEAAAATRGGGGTIAGQSRGGVEGHSSSAGGAVATHGHATRGGVAEGVDEALDEARPRAGSSRSRGGAAAGGGGESEVSRQSGCGGEGHAGSAAGSLASLEDATAGTAVAAAGGTAPPDEPRPWTAASTRCWARAAAQVGVDGAVAAKRDRDRFGGGASDAVHDEGTGLVSVGGGGPPGMSRLGAEAQSRCEAATARRCHRCCRCRWSEAAQTVRQ